VPITLSKSVRIFAPFLDSAEIDPVFPNTQPERGVLARTIVVHITRA